MEYIAPHTAAWSAKAKSSHLEGDIVKKTTNCFCILEQVGNSSGTQKGYEEVDPPVRDTHITFALFIAACRLLPLRLKLIPVTSQRI